MKTVEQVPIRVQPNPHNERYLKAGAKDGAPSVIYDLRLMIYAIGF
jgi:hypothetical protein